MDADEHGFNSPQKNSKGARDSFGKSLAEVGSKSQPPLHFIRLVRVHPVAKPAPLRVARIQLRVGEFAYFCATPRFSRKAFQRARPTTVSVIVAVGMQTGKQIRDD